MSPDGGSAAREIGVGGGPQARRSEARDSCGERCNCSDKEPVSQGGDKISYLLRMSQGLYNGHH